MLELLDRDESQRHLIQSLAPAYSREQLRDSANSVKEIFEESESGYLDALDNYYSVVQRFLPKLMEVIGLQGNEEGKEVLEGLRWIVAYRKDGCEPLFSPPMSLVPKRWKKRVLQDDGRVDKRSYTFCVVIRLLAALKRRDIFIGSDSTRWGNPYSNLVPEDKWRAMKHQHCQRLGLSSDFDSFFGNLVEKMGTAYQQVSSRAHENPAFTTQEKCGKPKVKLKKLSLLPEPTSLLELRDSVWDLLPRVELPEVLLEIDNFIDFTSGFSHISGGTRRAADISTSLAAIILAEACNVGLDPVTHEGHPALNRDRLRHVMDMYYRGKGIEEANRIIIDAHSELRMSQIWGDGSVASADGIRFKVPVPSVSAALNRKYFGTGKGVVYYTYTSDQYTGFFGKVIPGNSRDSLYILDGLLQQKTNLRPHELMTDTAGFSDVVFSLFSLLGYTYSPRIASFGKLSFYKTSVDQDCGIFESFNPKCIRRNLIKEHWDDILRMVVSLKEGYVIPSDLMRTLQSGRGQSSLAKALAELGKLFRTLHMLQYIDSEEYRRAILFQLNLGEQRNALFRAINHGKKGGIRKRYLEEQSDQLDCLSLVANIVVFWNTLYIQKAVRKLIETGHQVRLEDLKRLSPLVRRHINLVGRYYFELQAAVKSGELRPLQSELGLAA